MKKLLILLMVFAPLLRVISFAQEPIADLRILSSTIVNQNGKVPEKQMSSLIFLEANTYYIKLVIKNEGKKTYNGALQVSLYNEYIRENQKTVLNERKYELRTNKTIEAVFELSYEQLKPYIYPRPLALDIRCSDKRNKRILWIYLEQTPESTSGWKVIIGKDALKQYIDHSYRLDEGLRKLEEKRLERENNKKSNF